MTKMLDRLERLELLERTKHPTDRRATLVVLTSYGKKTFKQSCRVIENFVQSNLGDALTTQGLQNLSDGLTELLESHGRLSGQMKHLAGKPSGE